MGKAPTNLCNNQAIVDKLNKEENRKPRTTLNVDSSLIN